MPQKKKQNDSLPWYHEGLRFECTQCGDCCSGAPGYVWVEQDEIDALAKRMEMAPEEFEKMYVRDVRQKRSLREFPNGDCVFLHETSRGCTVYEDRPKQCRTWPFWNSNISTPQEWKETQRGCPGCNKGTLYTLEQIESRRKVIDI